MMLTDLSDYLSDKKESFSQLLKTEEEKQNQSFLEEEQSLSELHKEHLI